MSSSRPPSEGPATQATRAYSVASPVLRTALSCLTAPVELATGFVSSSSNLKMCVNEHCRLRDLFPVNVNADVFKNDIIIHCKYIYA